MWMKLRNLVRFLWASAAACALLLVVFLRVTGCSALKPAVTPAATTAQASPTGLPPQPVSAQCRAEGWGRAAQANANSLPAMPWSPFGRAETGWEIYVPLIQNEIATACPPDSEGFAKALAAWERRTGLAADGLMDELAFLSMKGTAQTRREFVRFTSTGACPGTPDLVAAARPEEGYGGKPVWMRPAALAAYRRMAAAARAEVPEARNDPRFLTVFSGYRSPSADAARCAAEGNCDGIVRARCSAHRTGLAADLYVGQAPGYGPDSSADPNRLAMTRTATYRWLVANAGRFGFVNYPFEPWHWEWTGEAP